MRRIQAACKEALATLSRRWMDQWQHPLYPAGTPWIMKEQAIEVKDWEDGLEAWDWRAYGPVCGISGYATTLPGKDSDQAKAEITAALEAAFASCDCSDVYPPRVEWVYRFMDPCEVSPTEPIVQTLSQAYQRVTAQTSHIIGGVRSDLYMLALHGQVPTVSFGVGNVMRGSGSAHEPNERIDINEELIPYVKALTLAVMDWCGYN
jgi:acetylornithine deacetylase/succinyl-diaminopimelate desuccinylase-like protein